MWCLFLAWFVDIKENVDYKKMRQMMKKHGLKQDELKNEDLTQELKNDRKLAGIDDFATIYLIFFK